MRIPGRRPCRLRRSGYASHAEINYVPNNLAVIIPENVSARDAAYSTIGAIAMQGVRQSQASVGDRVMVVGLGLIGQLTVQILRAAGCRVIGVDISDFAVQKCLMSEHARATEGADDAIKGRHLIALNSNTQDIESIVSSTTEGFGVDKVIVTAGSKDSGPLILAGNVVRDRGCIVIVGAVPVDIPRSPFYEKEVDIRFSRSYGPGRYDPSTRKKAGTTRSVMCAGRNGEISSRSCTCCRKGKSISRRSRRIPSSWKMLSTPTGCFSTEGTIPGHVAQVPRDG